MEAIVIAIGSAITAWTAVAVWLWLRTLYLATVAYTMSRWEIDQRQARRATLGLLGDLLLQWPLEVAKRASRETDD